MFISSKWRRPGGDEPSGDDGRSPDGPPCWTCADGTRGFACGRHCWAGTCASWLLLRLWRGFLERARKHREARHECQGFTGLPTGGAAGPVFQTDFLRSPASYSLERLLHSLRTTFRTTSSVSRARVSSLRAHVRATCSPRNGQQRSHVQNMCVSEPLNASQPWKICRFSKQALPRHSRRNQQAKPLIFLGFLAFPPARVRTLFAFRPAAKAIHLQPPPARPKSDLFFPLFSALFRASGRRTFPQQKNPRFLPFPPFTSRSDLRYQHP